MCTDRNARLAAWMDTWGDQLLRTCVLLLGDRAMAEDAVQETFLKAWRAMDSFERRNDCTEKTWLMRIAVNTCRSMQRTAWFIHNDRRVVPEQLTIPDTERDRALLMDVQALPGRLRQAVVLHYFAGYTLDEMAQVTGIPRGTLYSRLQKALKLLRIDDQKGG